MTPSQMCSFIGSLGASGRTQGMQDNYGFGAKIAGFTRHPAGVTYVSCVDGAWGLVKFRKYEGEYEQERLSLGDGRYDNWIEPSPNVRPWGEVPGYGKVIQTHGTRVTLWGKSDDEDTTKDPMGKQEHKWLELYLNKRYFRIPKCVDLRVRDSLGVPSSGPAVYRRVHGMESYLSKIEHCDTSGSVKLEGCTVHWWILTPHKDWGGTRSNTSSYEGNGHVACLYQDELYEMRTGREGRNYLQKFGITFGSKRVVLYVEPTVSAGLTTDTARTKLILDDSDFPWNDVADQFRTMLPMEIRDLEETLGSGVIDPKNAKAVSEVLKDVANLYTVGKYVRSSVGAASANCTSYDLGKPHNSRPGTKSPRRRDPYLGSGSKERANPSKGAEFPTVIWKSKHPEDGESLLDDGELDDRAAHYEEGPNIVTINRDFPAFGELENDIVGKLGVRPGVPQLVRARLKFWLEVQLTEAISGARSMKTGVCGTLMRINAVLATNLSQQLLCQSCTLTARCLWKSERNLVQSEHSNCIARPH